MKTRIATVLALALAMFGAGGASAQEGWYTGPPDDNFVVFGIAENLETEFGLPLFVCEPKGVTLEVFPGAMRASPRWKPPKGRVTAEISGRGPSGAFSSGPLPVSFGYNKDREMWTLSGPIALDNPLWQGLPGAATLQLVTRGKRETLLTRGLAKELPVFLDKCRALMGKG